MVGPTLDSFHCHIGQGAELSGRITDPKFENGEWLATAKVSSNVEGLAGDYRARWLYGSLLMRRGGTFDLNLSLLLFEPELESDGEAALAVRTRIPTGFGPPQRLTGTCDTKRGEGA
jgi:hypothetical protein